MAEAEGEARTPAASRKSRRGSERRWRGLRIVIRVSSEEYARAAAAANGAGLSLASYVRQHGVPYRETIPRRRPSVDAKALAKGIAEVNKVGSNVAQLLRRVNFGETPLVAELHETMTDCRVTVAALRAAAGHEQPA